MLALHISPLMAGRRRTILKCRMVGEPCTIGSTVANLVFVTGQFRWRLTWLVQTLLKVTKANVCASIVDARSFFARTRGMAIAERSN